MPERQADAAGSGNTCLEPGANRVVRCVWNLAVQQHAHWQQGRKPTPGFAEQCQQLTEARREYVWLGSGHADVQQQALKDFAKAKSKNFKHEGFRVIGTDRVPEWEPDGRPKRNATTGKQVIGRSVRVQKLNRRWAQVKVPGCGWVRFRLTRTGLPEAGHVSQRPVAHRVRGHT
ncbi:hypothetical protein [Streptomyces sp. AK02-04a]|uniref:hypothetical protein n=1 Tax=Streptomyces sp. AK02-04a TaxID=3028649 RepID=UPI0029A6CA9A|nr:hypothetical protein [Streptomyces sp. AK02-04a]MDX3762776.1 hypothetical protein [Streptomyces sp. AK02-04a]